MYNRKQRRKIEKELGLLSKLKTLSPAEQKEIKKRKREMGREIHLRNTQEREALLESQNAEKYAKIIQNLVESGKTQEEANMFIAKYKEKHDERDAKKHAKK